MELEDLVRSPTRRTQARAQPLAPHIDEFVACQALVGYTHTSLCDLISGVIDFGAYLAKHGVLNLRELRSSHVDAYVATQRRTRCRGHSYPATRGVRGARHLLRYARSTDLVPPELALPAPPYAKLLDDWLVFLKTHRGLALESLAVYARHVRRFLDALGRSGTPAGLRRLDPYAARAAVREAVKGRAHSGRKLFVSTVRIFLRYAWEQGFLTRDLSIAVERVPTFKHDRLPRGPRWDDALRLLEAPNRATVLGRRDYAILQLLLTYGVRAQQISRLTLDDIDWHAAKMGFQAQKGGRPVELPLLPAVGEAVLAYLRDGRPKGGCRAVFLTTRPPFRLLTSSAISTRVSRAFEQLGISSPHRGSHALRHAWATRLLAEGQSLKTIADLMGHRSIETTRIYSKVDFARLRTVGLPWPKGVRP